MKFHEIFKRLRLQDGYTQQELATILGSSRSTIGMYELGKREPDLETLEKIADLFNVSLDYLNGKSNLPFDSNSDNIIPLPVDAEEEYLLAARSKDGKQAVRRLTKKQYEIAKSVVESLELNEDETL